MAEIKEAMPAPQPEALDMPDDEVLYELADLFLSLIHISEPTRH